MDPKTIELMDSMKRRNSERGLDVRCPTCDHGIGQFCLKAGVKRHMTADDIAIHPARVDLARAQGFVA